MNTRFDWTIDPCDRYQIWDQMEGRPASCGTDLLIFDTIEEADRVAAQLNEHGDVPCKCRSLARGDDIGFLPRKFCFSQSARRC